MNDTLGDKVGEVPNRTACPRACSKSPP